MAENLIKLNAHVFYWEDTDVNGIEDDHDNPSMPFAVFDENLVKKDVLSVDDGWRWRPIIDADTGMIVGWPQGTVAKVHYKVCDECEIDYVKDGNKICDNEGEWYCPNFLCPAGEGYGDYIIMDIDENGQILKWNEANFEKWVKRHINQYNEDDE